MMPGTVVAGRAPPAVRVVRGDGGDRARTSGSRPSPLMHHGRPLLLDLGGTRTPCPAEGLEQRAATVNSEAAEAIWRGVTAVLIRPDARIAWASTDTDPQRRAADCLTTLRTLCR
ncbi:aromatic-ring hydroxylase C-terminal domain-containing protein [Streptomyces lydicus]|uniref:aromatic-ring hydroxylase C-terminal domain-containing protein n=1 Tax=Streptomyces lydicus TaxID=47763 RepID=UPI0037AA6434